MKVLLLQTLDGNIIYLLIQHEEINLGAKRLWYSVNRQLDVVQDNI